VSVRIFGAGPEPALALHCTMAQGGAWAGFARHMDARLHLAAPDLAGHGAGPVPDRARDFHEQATEAAEGHLPAAPCHLIGHSLGATIALRLALEHPERVRSLTLIEPVLFCAADGPGRAAHDAAFAPLSEALARGDAAAAARVFLDLWGAQPFDTLPPSQQAYITERVWIPPATEPALVADNARLLSRLPSVSTPTLLLDGALSPPVIAEINDAFAKRLPDVRRVTVPAASHMVPITHARATAAAHSAFLATL
jgi:pimeloyl-ACP methyl ester carboxylesterase